MAAGLVQQFADVEDEIELRFRSDSDRDVAVERLQSQGLRVRKIAPHLCSVQGATDGDRLIALVTSVGIHPTEVTRKRTPLEEAYLQLLREHREAVE